MLMFYCFRRVTLPSSHAPVADAGEDESGTAWGTRLSLDLVVYLTYSAVLFDKQPPRFVFACGSVGAVLRSADRGRTWRKITVSRDTMVKDALPLLQGTAQGSTNSDPPADDATTLNEILALLPHDGAAATAYNDDDIEGDTPADVDECSEQRSSQETVAAPIIKSALTAQPDVSCVCCCGDTVCVGGGDGLLAVSVDRGATYCAAPPSVALGCLRDRTKSKFEFLQVRGVAFLRGDLVVFHTLTAVCSIPFRVTGVSSVTFGVAQVLMKFPKGPIGCVVASEEAGSTARSLWVSVKGALHWSFDGGRTFISIGHQLGLIRCLVPQWGHLIGDVPKHPNISEALDAVGVLRVPSQHAMREPPPPSAACADASDNNTKPEGEAAAQSTKKFTFSLPSSLAMRSDELAQQAAKHFAVPAITNRSKTRQQDLLAQQGAAYRRFFVLCTQGRVVPYDFTGVLHVMMASSPTSPGSLLCHTTASHVDYIPFVQSLHHDAVGLDVVVRRSEVDEEGNFGHCLVRSTSSGVSTSQDFGRTWSAPTRAFTGTVRSLDEGCFVVASQRRAVVVTDDFGANFATVALPAALRVPVISDIAVMR